MGRKEFLLPGLYFFILPFLLWNLYAFWAGNFMLYYILWLFLTSLLLILLISLTPSIIKRLHDIGLPTWFGVICLPTALIILYVCTFFFWPAVTDSVLLYVILWVLLLVHTVSVLFILLKPGNETENKYGAVSVYKKKKIRILFWLVLAVLTYTVIFFSGPTLLTLAVILILISGGGYNI